MPDAPFRTPPSVPDDADPRRSLPLLVDCAGCQVRGPACDDCVVSVLLGPVPERLRLDADEVSALGALAGAGLVPPLRLVQSLADPSPDRDRDEEPG